MGIVDEFGVIVDATEEIRILHNDEHGVLVYQCHEGFRSRLKIDIGIVTRFFDSHTL